MCFASLIHTHWLTICRLNIKKCHCTCSSSWQLFASSFSPLISTAKHTELHEPQCCTGVRKLIAEVWANPLRSRKQSGSMWHSEGHQAVDPGPALSLLHVSSLHREGFSQPMLMTTPGGHAKPMAQTPLLPISQSVSQGVVSVMSMIHEITLGNVSSLQKQALTGTWAARFKGLWPLK